MIGQLYAPAALPLGKAVGIHRRMGGPQSRALRKWGREKLLTLLGFEPRTVQSLSSLITQYVLPLPNKQITTLLHGVSDFVPVYIDGMSC
jgi:hypothetical protein